MFLRRDSDSGRRSAPTVADLDRGDVAHLVETIRSGRPDFVLFEGVALLDAMRRIRDAFPALPMIVDFHNVESALYREVREARVPRWARPLARPVLAAKFGQAEQADREAARIADSVWTCSARDADQVREAGWARSVHVVANPIPGWCGTAAPHSLPRAGRTILFVGHLGYPPNRRAIDELVSQTLPRLRGRFPDARLHVCGRSPRDRLVRLLNDNGHRLSANPPDLLPIYRDAAAAVIPLRQGGGTRIKVLEALAVGCPIVATAKAVEGLSIEDGRHFLRAETTADFMQALSRLFEDPELGGRLAAEGKDFVRREHGDTARADAIGAALAALRAG